MNHTKHNEKEAFKIIEQFNYLNTSRAPISDFLSIVDAENLIITLRDTDIIFKGIAGLADHQIGKLIFFDQKLDCELVNSETKNNEITLWTKGVWYARTWHTPDALSQQLVADLKHTWVLKKTKQATYILLTHICDYFKYREGLSPGSGSQDFHLSLK